MQVDDAVLTVTGIRFDQSELIHFKGRTAAALEISFEERGPINGHPDQDVQLIKF